MATAITALFQLNVHNRANRAYRKVGVARQTFDSSLVRPMILIYFDTATAGRDPCDFSFTEPVGFTDDQLRTVAFIAASAWSEGRSGGYLDGSKKTARIVQQAENRIARIAENGLPDDDAT